MWKEEWVGQMGREQYFLGHESLNCLIVTLVETQGERGRERKREEERERCIQKSWGQLVHADSTGMVPATSATQNLSMLIMYSTGLGGKDVFVGKQSPAVTFLGGGSCGCSFAHTGHSREHSYWARRRLCPILA